MATTFTCKSSPKILMTDAIAAHILKTMGKIKETDAVPPWGVLTRGEIDRAVDQLRKTLRDSKEHEKSEAMKRDVAHHHSDHGDDDEHNPSDHVSFATHLIPFLKMLELVQKDHTKEDQILWNR